MQMSKYDWQGMMELHDDAKWVGGGLCGNHQGTGAGWMKDDGEAGCGWKHMLIEDGVAMMVVFVKEC